MKDSLDLILHVLASSCPASARERTKRRCRGFFCVKKKNSSWVSFCLCIVNYHTMVDCIYIHCSFLTYVVTCRYHDCSEFGLIVLLTNVTELLDLYHS